MHHPEHYEDFERFGDWTPGVEEDNGPDSQWGVL